MSVVGAHEGLRTESGSTVVGVQGAHNRRASEGGGMSSGIPQPSGSGVRIGVSVLTGGK